MLKLFFNRISGEISFNGALKVLIQYIFLLFILIYLRNLNILPQVYCPVKFFLKIKKNFVVNTVVNPKKIFTGYGFFLKNLYLKFINSKLI